MRLGDTSIPCLSGSGPLSTGQVYCAGYGPEAGNIIPCLNGTGPLAPGQGYCVTAGNSPYDDVVSPCTDPTQTWDPTLQTCVSPSGTGSAAGISDTTLELLVGGAFGILVLSHFLAGGR